MKFIEFNNSIVNLKEVVYITVRYSTKAQRKTGVVVMLKGIGEMIEWYDSEDEACERYHEFLGLIEF